MTTFRLVNFGHSVESGEDTIETMIGSPIERPWVDVPVQLDTGRSFVDQVASLVAGVPIEQRMWEGPLVVCLPGHPAIAAIVLAHVHGRRGSFPLVVRFTHEAGVWSPSDVIDLQGARDASRSGRHLLPGS